MRRALLLMLTMIFSLRAFAQETGPVQKSFLRDPFSDPMMPFYLVAALIFMVIILVGIVALHLIKVLNRLTAEAETAQNPDISHVPKPNWWDRFVQKMNASVPVEEEQKIDLDHSYDGIRELDNHLPPWWKWLFIGTHVFAVIYVVLFHFTSTLPLQEQEYHNELAAAEEQAIKFKASQPKEEVDENTLVFTADLAKIEKGKSIFISNNCGSCHRNDGGGNIIGPNLTDEYWLHGGDVKQVFHIIKNGVVEKGMPAWGKSMSLQNVRDVTFFIMSLQGSNPPNPKVPQGDLFKSLPPVSDTTKVQIAL